MKPRKIWYDETVKRLNADGRGDLIGEFRGEDRLLIINQDGLVKTILPELSSHFDNSMIVLEKWIPKKPITVIHYDGEKEKYFFKRFLIENENKEECVISDHNQSFMELVSTDWKPMLQIVFAKERGKDRRDNLEINARILYQLKE